jgi:hypothetical protein
VKIGGALVAHALTTVQAYLQAGLDGPSNGSTGVADSASTSGYGDGISPVNGGDTGASSTASPTASTAGRIGDASARNQLAVVGSFVKKIAGIGYVYCCSCWAGGHGDVVWRAGLTRMQSLPKCLPAFCGQQRSLWQFAFVVVWILMNFTMRLRRCSTAIAVSCSSTASQAGCVFVFEPAGNSCFE